MEQPMKERHVAAHPAIFMVFVSMPAVAPAGTAPAAR